MEVEFLDRLNDEALILIVRWTESSIQKNETATVCVQLSDDEALAGGFEPEERVSIEIPDRIRSSAMTQAQQLAQVLSGLYSGLYREISAA